MDPREEKIVDAAFNVFSRYGVKRTTMSDIANEAGLARQTLYNVFENKDEVLRATIRLFADRALRDAEAECAKTEDVGDQLDIVFKYMVVRPFERIRETPHGEEIVAGICVSAMQEIARNEDRTREMLERLLAPYQDRIRAAGMVPGDLAEVIQKAWYGCKHKARNKKHLLRLLDGLKALVLAVVNDGR